MSIKKTKKALKVHGIIGTALCSIAGAIVGFIFGGPLLAIPGFIAGTAGSHLIQKSISAIIA